MNPTKTIKPIGKGSVRLPSYKAKELDAVSLSQTKPWLYNVLGIDAIHQKGITGKGQVVAVLDTGTCGDHPDLKGTVIGSKSWIEERGGVFQDALDDKNGHGVWCHGIIGAQDNETGIKGVAYDAKFLICRVLSNGGYGNLTKVVKAGDWAVKNGATIITASLGSMKESPLLKKAIRRWTEQGIIFVCAAGNEGRRGMCYPGWDLRSITVGAIDYRKQVADFSSIGKGVDVVAPGVHLNSTWKNGGYAKLSGTSMATPVVAGIIALIKSIPNNTKYQTQSQIEKLLKKTAIDLGQQGFDESSGAGLVNIDLAIDKVFRSIDTGKENQKANSIKKEAALKCLEMVNNYIENA